MLPVRLAPCLSDLLITAGNEKVPSLRKGCRPRSGIVSHSGGLREGVILHMQRGLSL
jgi:hypothetical protein